MARYRIEVGELPPGGSVDAFWGIRGAPKAKIGTFDVELIHDFLLALTNQAGMNLHVRMGAGRNPHHVVEATFKSLARALDVATQRDPRLDGVLSTKGTL